MRKFIKSVKGKIILGILAALLLTAGTYGVLVARFIKLNFDPLLNEKLIRNLDDDWTTYSYVDERYVYGLGRARPRSFSTWAQMATLTHIETNDDGLVVYISDIYISFRVNTAGRINYNRRYNLSLTYLGTGTEYRRYSGMKGAMVDVNGQLLPDFEYHSDWLFVYENYYDEIMAFIQEHKEFYGEENFR
ncbi:MAG: hypothetical protein FWE91_02455 [Defluviitaleaceae bacterium]|nr:hypothetical protein [Defluviitaleaceae bacterium]MCL2835169.1 hypothetical protein [Defluviitaleaceae bacterium]